ncbi:3'(2'),5'-bisphosphate nucleotidase CysQ [Candidatus Woesearchaeota archaeon]|nr:3'(2'),5'-bisphosphate nucleotidase CysQ [Candidatus Woesearchaeota archaeon]
MNELEFAKKLAKDAGNIVMKYYGKSSKEMNTQVKENNTFLTQADIEANNYITEQIKKHFPEDGILTEETIDNKKRLQKSRVWIIDPLDGTHHFLKNRTEFSISIGLVENVFPVLGVIYKPIGDELYFAEKKQGAYLEENGKTRKLSVTKETEIKNLRVTASKATAQQFIKEVVKHSPFRTFEFRGSTCYKMCLVAKGEYDAYIRDHLQINEWDVCAGTIIVQEAGGLVTDIEGKPLIFNNETPLFRGIIASNNVCHDNILNEISKTYRIK